MSDTARAWREIIDGLDEYRAEEAALEAAFEQSRERFPPAERRSLNPVMRNLALLCRRHHVLWHQGKLQHHHLTIPWHPDQTTAPPDPLDDLFEQAGP
jgi:hypothetical protein